MRKFFVSLAVFASPFIIRAQSITPRVINSTGGSFKVFDNRGRDNSFFLDWSVGEMTLVNTMRTAGDKKFLYIITNGFLQPEFGPDEGNEDHLDKTIFLTSSDIKVFPNPAVDYVDVNFLLADAGNAKLTLYNSMGQQVYAKEISINGKTRIEHIPMNGFTQGSYMLYIQVIMPGNKTRQGSFKIVKTN